MARFGIMIRTNIALNITQQELRKVLAELKYKTLQEFVEREIMKKLLK
jgi:hypothetical protein